MGGRIESSGSTQRSTLIVVTSFALVLLSYFFVDRPVAEALRPNLAGAQFFVWLTYIVKPLTPLASVIAAVVAARSVARGSMTPAESALLRLSCAVLVAGVLTFELKEVFGRTWPETWIDHNPSYFGNGTYGFFPFHGGRGYASFPSGHTTAISALAGAVWFLWPQWRWGGVALVLAVAIGLLGSNYHWLSDIIAGTIVGGATGAAAAHVGPYKKAA
jgi:membrane-associated phospholipid phosphatase